VICCVSLTRSVETAFKMLFLEDVEIVYLKMFSEIGRSLLEILHVK
jgi:hypothetical protein